MDNFNPDTDIPSLEDKVIFITGGTAGLGKNSLRVLAKKRPARIYFTGRNASRAQGVIDEVQKLTPGIQITFIECDFTSLASIRSGLKKFTEPRLDILMCNAGIMAKGPQLTKDGYELQFAVNHLAHFLIVTTLLPTLLHTTSLPSSDVRIINLTSEGWKGGLRTGIKFDTLDTTQTGVMGHFIRYCQSKFANTVFTMELAKRYPEITTVSIHPGVVKTGLVTELGIWNYLFVCLTNINQMVEEEVGMLNQLWAAAGAKKRELVSGAYYMPVGKNCSEDLKKIEKPEELGKKLWDWSEKAIAK